MCTHVAALAGRHGICPSCQQRITWNERPAGPWETWIHPRAWGWGGRRPASVFKCCYTPMATSAVCVQAFQDAAQGRLLRFRGQQASGIANKTPTPSWVTFLYLTSNRSFPFLLLFLFFAMGLDFPDKASTKLKGFSVNMIYLHLD